MAADRAAFIDQSQSLNIHIKDPTMGKLTSMHFYGWKKGLKTGMYYLRTQAASAAIQFTIDKLVAESAGQTVANLDKLHIKKYVNKGRVGEENTSDAPRSKSPSTEPTSLENSIADLKITDNKPAETPAETKEEEPVDNRTIEEIENDIYSAKVIACAIDNPESCTMCSG